ncbi:MAG: phosphatase PAP2 family protein [Chlorobiaceae bacterium]|nr:phosphatase PAP2 family protein [Chlorobiaceae bacterium]
MNDRRQRQLLLLFATLLLCAISFFLFDKPLTLFFQQFNTGLWRDIWKAITRAGQSEWYLVGGLALYAWFRKRNRILARKGLFLFTTVAVSGLTADLLKFVFGRARPKLLLHDGIYGFEPFGHAFNHAWQSFPSGHSTTALSAALSLSLMLPRLRPVFIIAGIIIAASRVVLCQHYLSDIIAGSTLGVVTVMLLYQRFFPASADDKPGLPMPSSDHSS